jgi:CheY-like chemotaxis protein
MSAILVVEDDHDNARLACEAMNRIGHDSLVVEDGPNALDRARNWHPDLILLDVSLAGPLTGLQVCEALRADADLEAIPVVMLSGWAFDNDVRAGQSPGANASLTKPFSPTELQALVQLLLDSRAGHVSA